MLFRLLSFLSIRRTLLHNFLCLRARQPCSKNVLAEVGHICYPAPRDLLVAVVTSLWITRHCCSLRLAAVIMWCWMTSSVVSVWMTSCWMTSSEVSVFQLYLLQLTIDKIYFPSLFLYIIVGEKNSYLERFSVTARTIITLH